MASALPSGSWKKAWRQTPESIGSPGIRLRGTRARPWRPRSRPRGTRSDAYSWRARSRRPRTPSPRWSGSRSRIPGPACCPSALTRRDRDIRVEVASLLKVVRGHRDEVDAGDDARGWGHVALLNRGRSNPTPSTEGVGPQRRTPRHSVVGGLHAFPTESNCRSCAGASETRHRDRHVTTHILR